MTELWTNVDEAEKYPKISITELNSLLRCTQKHQYAYRQGLVPVATPGYFTKGKYLHRLQEIFWRSVQDGEPFVLTDAVATIARIARREMQEDDEPVDSDVAAEVDEVFAAWHRDILPRVENYTVEAVEQEFLIDVDIWNAYGPVLLHGIIDLVVRDEANNLWVVEHKTASRAWSLGNFLFDFQSRLYLRAVERYLLEAPDGLIFQFFYPKRYESKQVTYASEEIDAFVTEACAAVELRDKGIVLRQPHWGCNDCSFKALCHAELLGDGAYIRANQFTVDQEKVDRFIVE